MWNTLKALLWLFGLLLGLNTFLVAAIDGNIWPMLYWFAGFGLALVVVDIFDD